MPYQFSPFGNDQFLDANGNLAIGYKLFVYLAGTSTKESVASNLVGTAFHTNPIVITSLGLPPAPLYLDIAKSYKFVLATPSDTDPPSAPIYTADNVAVTSTGNPTEWIPGTTPTYISGTQFSVGGDQRTTYHVGRRVKLDASGSTAYGTISAVAFTSVTTVTVIVDNLGVISSSLAAVSYGFLAAVGSSWPSGFNTGLLTSFYGGLAQRMASPFLRMIGLEASAKDIRVTESGGVFLVQRNDGTEIAPIWIELFRIDPVTVLYTGKRSQVFTANGNFTVPDGVYNLELRVWGAGGGGGGGGGGAGGTCTASGACGAAGSLGASGGYATLIVPVTPGTIYAVTVGSGGAGGVGGGGGGSGGSGAAGGVGGTGGVSSVGALLSCTGGGGGSGGSGGPYGLSAVGGQGNPGASGVAPGTPHAGQGGFGGGAGAASAGVGSGSPGSAGGVGNNGRVEIYY